MMVMHRTHCAAFVLSLAMFAPASSRANDRETSAAFVSRNSIAQAVADDIRRKELRAKQLWSFADTIDNDRNLGTAMNEVGIPEGTCYALGRLLGHPEAVAHLKLVDDANLSVRTPDNARVVREVGLEMGNFAGAENSALQESHGERILEWNLDCAGHLGIPAKYEDQGGIDTFFTVSENGEDLRILGDIENDFAARLADAVMKNPKVKHVVLGSGGGNVYQALLAGEFIRTRNLKTVLGDWCYSACPLVFMGGVQRTICSPFPALGFHQISDKDGKAVLATDRVYRDVANYLLRMGVESTYVLHQMWSAQPHDMHVVQGVDEELCKAHVATWVQRHCSAPM